MKNIFFCFFLILIMVSIFSCANNSGKKATKSENLKEDELIAEPNDRIIYTDSHMLIQRTKKQFYKMIYFPFETNYDRLESAISIPAKEIFQKINKYQFSMAGEMFIELNSWPEKNVKTEFKFCQGIKNIKGKINPTELIGKEASISVIKVECKGGIGTAYKYVEKLKEILRQKNITVAFPIYESYASGTQSEMTTIMTKTILYLPVKN